MSDHLDRHIDDAARAMCWPEQRGEGESTARALGLALVALAVAVVLVVAAVVAR